MFSKLPYLIAISGIFGGLVIAILFGVNENYFKNNIAEGLAKNTKIQQIEDGEVKKAKIAKESSKNWRYYQRFHFHASAIGAMSLALLIFLALIQAPKGPRSVLSYSTAVSGFLYPFVWLFAGIYGPEMGRHEAKEAFAIFGYMGGIYLLSVLGIMVLTVMYPCHANRLSDEA